FAGGFLGTDCERGGRSAERRPAMAVCRRHGRDHLSPSSARIRVRLAGTRPKDLLDLRRRHIARSSCIRNLTSPLDGPQAFGFRIAPSLLFAEVHPMLGRLQGRHASRLSIRRRNRSRRPALDRLEARALLTGFLTSSPAYLRTVAVGVSTTPLLTTGDIVDRTGVAFQQYRMVGIPDGLGAYQDAAGTVHLFMNHEFTKPTTSEPVANAGPYTGAWVSQFSLSPTDGSINSGDLAYQTVVRGTDPTPLSGAFGRFCSGFL